jgi:hypothetical protein
MTASQPSRFNVNGCPSGRSLLNASYYDARRALYRLPSELQTDISIAVFDPANSFRS